MIDSWDGYAFNSDMISRVAPVSEGPDLSINTQRMLPFRLFLLLLWFSFGFTQPMRLIAATGDVQQDSAEASISSSFHCPEEYTSDAAKQKSLQDFLQQYGRQFPNNNVRDVMIFRYRLLVTHSCKQTLKSMLTNLSPITEIVRFQDQDFGPKTEEFNAKTDVWSVFFRKDGEPPALSNEDLIFNFYGPGRSPEGIAEAFIRPRPDLTILGQFQAPDEITKQPAYFTVSETLYPGEKYGYINLSKISSTASGTYTVTLAKKITGTTTENIGSNGKVWFVSEEGKVAARILGQVGVDPTWQRHFAQAQKGTPPEEGR
jgi:hypothetical protein